MLQLIFNLLTFLTGAVISGRGASLIDLVQIYQSDMATMGVYLVYGGLGTFISSLAVGYILELAGGREHLVLSLFLLLGAISTLLMPYGGLVYIFWFANFLFASACSCYWVATNVQCLRMWRHTTFGSAPFVHSLILCYDLGFFSGSMLCTPLLSQHSSNVNNNEIFNTTDASEVIVNSSYVHLFFLAVGITFLLLAIAIIALGPEVGANGDGTTSGDCQTKEGHVDLRDSQEMELPASYHWQKRALILLLSNVYAVDYIMIMGISNFLVVAVMNSELHLSKVEGAFLISIFFLGQLTIAAANSILSRWLTPNQTVAISLSLIFVSSSLILYAMNTSLILLQVSLLLLGLGTGSMLAVILVWLDQFISVGPKTNGIMISFIALGLIGSGLIFAPHVESFPDIIAYYLLAMFIALLFIFSVGGLIGSHIKRVREEHKEPKEEKREGSSELHQIK